MSLAVYPEMGLLDCVPSVFLVFRHLHTVFHSRCTKLHSHQHCVFPFLHTSPVFVILIFWAIAILTGLRWHLILVLTCTSVNVNDVEHLLVICIFFFRTISWDHLPSKWIGGFLIAELLSLLMNLCISSLSDSLQIFLSVLLEVSPLYWSFLLWYRSSKFDINPF